MNPHRFMASKQEFTMVNLTTWFILIFTFLLPVAPVGYMLYFRKQGDIVIEELKIPKEEFEDKAILTAGVSINTRTEPDESKLPDDTTIKRVNQDEPGFKEVKKSIQNHRGLNRNLKQLCIFAGNMESIGNSLSLAIPDIPMAEHNVVFCTKYKDGTYDIIAFHPSNPYDTGQLTQLQQWVRDTAITESWAMTVTLAVVLFLLYFVELI